MMHVTVRSTPTDTVAPGPTSDALVSALLTEVMQLGADLDVLVVTHDVLLSNHSAETAIFLGCDSGCLAMVTVSRPSFLLMRANTTPSGGSGSFSMRSTSAKRFGIASRGLAGNGDGNRGIDVFHFR